MDFGFKFRERRDVNDGKSRAPDELAPLGYNIHPPAAGPNIFFNRITPIAAIAAAEDSKLDAARFNPLFFSLIVILPDV